MALGLREQEKGRKKGEGRGSDGLITKGRRKKRQRTKKRKEGLKAVRPTAAAAFAAGPSRLRVATGALATLCPC